MPPFQRARAPAQKADRRLAILQAAAELLREQGTLPTAAAMAARTGIGKGTLYLYFRSKEEAYLALLEHTFLQFLRALHAELACHEQINAAQVADTLLQTLQQHRDFVNLAALSTNILEQNASNDALLAYRRALTDDFSRCITLIHARSDIPAERVRQLLLCSYALITGLWQCAHQPASIKALPVDDLALLLTPDFARELDFGLRLLWRD